MIVYRLIKPTGVTRYHLPSRRPGSSHALCGLRMDMKRWKIAIAAVMPAELLCKNCRKRQERMDGNSTAED